MSKQTCPGCGVEHDPMDWHDELLHNEDRCVLAALQTARSKLHLCETKLAGQEAITKGYVDRLDAAETQIGKLHDLLHDKNDEIVSLTGAVSSAESERDRYIEDNIRLQSRLEACEAALRSFDVGRESSYWASEVERQLP